MFPLPGMHHELYCEQRSEAAGTERSNAEIILSAISHKYLTKREEMRRGQAGALGCVCGGMSSERPVIDWPWTFRIN